MFHTTGKICALDCIQEIAIRLSNEITSREQAGDIFKEFVNEIGHGWLIGVNGECVEVGPSFLSDVVDTQVESVYLGPDGITRQRYPSDAISRPQRLVLRNSLCGAIIGISLYCLYRLANALYSHLFSNGETRRLPLGWDLITISQTFFLTLVTTLVLVWIYSRFASYSHVKPYILPKPLIGLSLVFDRQELDQFLNQRCDTSEAPTKITKANEKAATEYILRSYRDNPRVTKADLRAILCAPNHAKRVSVRGFNRAWENATEVEPALSKPGRKS
jgi:hypothetical protein